MHARYRECLFPGTRTGEGRIHGGVCTCLIPALFQLSMCAGPCVRAGVTWMAPHRPALRLELVAGAGSCPACPSPHLKVRRLDYIPYINPRMFGSHHHLHETPI